MPGDRLTGWLVVVGFPKWQSRRDRRDPWLKDWLDQLDRDEYLTLTLAERGLISDIRKAYARHNGQLRAELLPGLIHARVRIKQLDRLVEAGYLLLSAAKPPPLRGRSDARAREEEEEEEERETEDPVSPSVASYDGRTDKFLQAVEVRGMP